MSDVGEKTVADFRFIFERLEKGMREKENEKLKNPVCLWSDCTRKSYPDVKCLYSHVKEHVPDPEANTAPVNRVYVCMWKTVAKSSAKKVSFITMYMITLGGCKTNSLKFCLKIKPKPSPRLHDK